MAQYYFYIIYSGNLDTFYIGHTSDIYSRIQKHNCNHKGFTGRSDDWRLVYQEVFSSKSTAFARERQVKKWKSRKKIEALINPLD